jgi:3-hydroxyisobutyrate dehydrogenase-like beta-hydroxyacid dehydrogenase
VACVPPDDAAVGVVGAQTATATLCRRLAAAGLRVHTADTNLAALREGCGVVVTLLPTENALRAALASLTAGGRPVVAVLDLSPIAPWTLRELAASCRETGVLLLGAAIVAAASREGARTTLHVDGDAAQLEPLTHVLAALADDVVSSSTIGRAKAVALLDDLLTGVNAAVVGEALALGRCAGLDARTLVALIQKGSGATSILAAHAAGDGPQMKACEARRHALARVTAAAQHVDHSSFFAGLGIAALLAQSLS